MRSIAVVAVVCATAIFAGCGTGSSTSGTVLAVPDSPVTTPVITSFRFTANPGTFYKDYVGPRRPGVDPIGADGVYLSASQTFVLAAQMAGPIFADGPDTYVWGFDRGGATAANAPFPDELAVRFNAVLAVTANLATGTLTGSLNLLNGTPAQGVPAVLVAPDTIQVGIPASMLPSTGFTPAQYRWNLWTRSGSGGSAAAQIPAFIPDNTMAPFLVR